MQYQTPGPDNHVCSFWLLFRSLFGRSTESKQRNSPREARAIAKLHHTNIVPLYDVGAGEEPFFAMQLIPGRSLDRALRRAKSSVDAQLGPASDSDTTAYDDSARRLLELKELADSRRPAATSWRG